MFWADKVAQELKKRKLSLEWVDDAKTPSGRVHVGALRGVVIHDLVYKSLIFAHVKSKYTYIFEDHDPMDGLPVYLPREKFEKYLGIPLYKVPSPQSGFKNYAEFYALEFKKVFNAIGCNPEIIWGTDLYLSGKMNALIKKSLDEVKGIRKIYEEIYNKTMPSNWYPFQVYCPNCNKVSTTNVIDWDGEKVSFECVVDKVKWTKGCGFTGKISPFTPNDKGDIAGKLTYKVEWPAKWKAIGVTMEWAGKDHMSRGGSFDVSSRISKEVFDYPVPNASSYEHFLLGGKKMSSSKGIGSSAKDMLGILPPEILRFLMVKTKYDQAINFDPSGDTIPKLFDEYQEYAEHYFSGKKDDYARIFELSQIDDVKEPPKVRFSTLTQWVQMPNMASEIKKESAQRWAKYAKIWIEKYASESEKFLVQENIPEKIKELSQKQKEFLIKLIGIIDVVSDAKVLEEKIYILGKEMGLSAKETFSAIYVSLLGKYSGPKASFLLLSLDKKFLERRFSEVIKNSNSESAEIVEVQMLNRPDLFYIDPVLKERFPSISVGIAVIRGVSIKNMNERLEKEKKELLDTLEELTTEKLGEYAEIKSYRKLYKETLIDWHSRRPSPEALLRRVTLKKGLYTVNTCVDAYNLVVMKHRVSVGAFDLDEISFPTVLRFSKDREKIFLLGDTEPVSYKKGEIAYFDQKGGYNIDFNFRDAQRTAVKLNTENIYMNVDGIYDINPSRVKKVLEEACGKIVEYCGGKIELLGVVI